MRYDRSSPKRSASAAVIEAETGRCERKGRLSCAKIVVRAAERSIAVRQNPMDTVADEIIIGWCDLDPKTRYRVAAAVVRLFKRPNDKAPYEWASLTRQLLLKAPDPDAVFNEIVDRLHPTSWSGSLTT